MAMWRCPHCSTPQAETARCWVCHRSTTACATCTHFRRSVAAQIGYCGLDRKRRPLRGDEIRGCWEAAGVATEATADARIIALTGTAVRKLDFVEVPTASASVLAESGSPGTTTGIPGTPIPPNPATIEPRWSLWGDPEI